jgi:hypothetical protein
VGREEAVSREYIGTQEAEDRRLDQMDLWEEGPPVGGSHPNRSKRFTASNRFERFHLLQASGFAGGR